ncbi:hypothetical protein Agub_g11575 [Astrephomene gubernaculifera]|uniref:RRM domain-containing protein n=1 Tax=Astrephomene gubernaculifera TaxID=47775 RepID=A0AAD3E189_9CHLO|nr:hypothetical protein Agub_g11575 [Astrephomene gubernaculifera]
MADRPEHVPSQEREAAPKVEYKKEQRRESPARDNPSARDYAKDFPPRDSYRSARDNGNGNSTDEKKIYVGGLDYSATKDDIYDAFSDAGKVVNVQLVVDHETQRSKGYAFVTFADEDAFLYALKRMNGVAIKGKSVVVNKALSAEEKALREREAGIQRDRDTDARHHHNSRPQHSERPHYDRPPGPQSKGFRVIITGLPDAYTWREMKDFLRTYTNAQPTYATVERPGRGYCPGAALVWSQQFYHTRGFGTGSKFDARVL